MKRTSRVTISQIAEVVGVHKSTVSLALRNDPRLSEATGDRIRKIALEMGYTPDAHLSNLMGYLRKISDEEVSKNETIAYITSEPSAKEDLDDKPYFREFHLGAGAELNRLGYELEIFRLREYDFRYSRLSKVLRSRNVHGVIVSPPVNILNLDEMDWSHFAAITLGHRLRSPRLHRVVCDQMRAMGMVLEHLESAGYKRPIFAYHKGRDRHSGRRWSITLKGSLRLFPEFESSRIYAGNADQSFVEFYKQSDADCVIGLSHDFASELQDSGVRFPQDVGFVLLDWHDGPVDFAGVDQRPASLGNLAARQIAGLLDRNELGLPDEPFTLALNPVWHPGKTL